MYFQERLSHEGDPLKTLRIFCLDIFKVRLCRMFLSFILVASVLVVLGTTCYATTHLNVTVFIKKGPFYFLLLYTLVCIFYILHFITNLEKNLKECPRWCPNVDKKTLNQKIAKEASQQTIFCYFTVSLGLSCALIYAVPSEKDDEILLSSDIINLCFLELQFLLSLCVRVSFFLFSLLMQLPLCQLVYFTLQFKFLVYYLLHHLENIEIDFDNIDPETLIFDNTYHQAINQRLIFCVKRHIEMIALNRKMLKRGGIFILFFSITGSLAGISIFLFILMVEDMPLIVYIRVLFLATIAIITGAGYVVQGQKYENACDDIFEILKRMKWYNWSVKNQKIFLKFLTTAIMGIKIKYSDGLVYNHQLGASVLKTVYSISCVMYRQGSLY